MHWASSPLPCIAISLNYPKLYQARAKRLLTCTFTSTYTISSFPPFNISHLPPSSTMQHSPPPTRTSGNNFLCRFWNIAKFYTTCLPHPTPLHLTFSLLPSPTNSPCTLSLHNSSLSLSCYHSLSLILPRTLALPSGVSSNFTELWASFLLSFPLSHSHQPDHNQYNATRVRVGSKSSPPTHTSRPSTSPPPTYWYHPTHRVPTIHWYRYTLSIPYTNSPLSSYLHSTYLFLLIIYISLHFTRNLSSPIVTCMY